MPETFTLPDTQTQLAQYIPTEESIAILAEKYLPLRIAGLDDREGYATVHNARMVIKGKRCDIEKRRKALGKEALEYGRAINARAKELTALLAPIETHLLEQEQAVDQEKERIANAARLKAEAEEQAKRDAEAARIKAEQDAENERLRAEREELARRAAAMEADRARMKAAQDKLEAERQAVHAEKLRLVETAARLAREAKEKEAREKAEAEAEEAARVRAEALRPDREKLLAVADAVRAIVVPGVSDEAEEAYIAVKEVLFDAEQSIRQAVEEMT